MSSSSCRSKLKCKAAWKAVTFQFWAAYLAPRLKAQWHDTAVSAGLVRQHAWLCWTTPTSSLSLRRSYLAEFVP